MWLNTSEAHISLSGSDVPCQIAWYAGDYWTGLISLISSVLPLLSKLGRELVSSIKWLLHNCVHSTTVMQTLYLPDNQWDNHSVLKSSPKWAALGATCRPRLHFTKAFRPVTKFDENISRSSQNSEKNQSYLPFRMWTKWMRTNSMTVTRWKSHPRALENIFLGSEIGSLGRFNIRTGITLVKKKQNSPQSNFYDGDMMPWKMGFVSEQVARICAWICHLQSTI